MITGFKRIAATSLAALALSTVALATPASSANENSRHGRWHGAAGGGSSYRHAHYKPGQDRVDQGPGYYQGYGKNSRNVCFPGESMYDGC